MRSHRSIELPDRRTLVAAKVWVSPYPIGVLIIHTSVQEGQSTRGEFGLNLGIGVYGGKLQFGGGALLPLNAALVALSISHVQFTVQLE
ncbi:hypothetical protein IOC51_06275 [Vibrio parahaemolyticus]|nr:hypothetical protein [Vibrio parahaemolyticus]